MGTPAESLFDSWAPQIHWRGIYLVMSLGLADLAWGLDSPPARLAEIVVSDKASLSQEQQRARRSSNLSRETWQGNQPASFSQAMSNVRGVDAQTACAFCGSKRIGINGLKGEHTTILIDGLSLHSATTGFYGVELIPLGALDSMTVSRGAGAALSAPESIGGSIELHTSESIGDGAQIEIAGSNDASLRASVLGYQRLHPNTSLQVGLSGNRDRALDLDSNRVAETPSQKSYSSWIKSTHKLPQDAQLSLRASQAKLQTVGGSLSENELSLVPTEAKPDSFSQRDVRRTYLGNPDNVTDNLFADRTELASIYRKEIGDDSFWELGIGGADQTQKLFSSHGYDYRSRDQIWTARASHQFQLSESQILSYGLDTKNQSYKSASQKLYIERNPQIPRDDFHLRSIGGFATSTWSTTDQTLNLSLRWENLHLRWTDLNQGVQQWILAPRANWQIQHNSVYASNISAGLGYRAPVTILASQHGLTHNGFTIELDRLETAPSLVYQIRAQRQEDFFDFGAHFTKVENMVIGVDRVSQGLPTQFRHSDESYLISVFDFGYGRRVFPHWTVEGLAEFFNYPDSYKAQLPVAAVEQRLTLSSNFQKDDWSASQKLVVIGGRDLSRYGYHRHFNVAPSDDPFDPSFGGRGTEPKWQRSPTFFTLDLEFERRLSDTAKAKLSLLNVFDYTQTRAGDSPLTWHEHGDHYHLDNFHLWGPNRGRQIWLTMNWEI